MLLLLNSQGKDKDRNNSMFKHQKGLTNPFQYPFNLKIFQNPFIVFNILHVVLIQRQIIKMFIICFAALSNVQNPPFFRFKNDALYSFSTFAKLFRNPSLICSK